jgi:hypothetical protein
MHELYVIVSLLLCERRGFLNARKGTRGLPPPEKLERSKVAEIELFNAIDDISASN